MKRKETRYICVHRAEVWDGHDYHCIVRRDGSLLWQLDWDAKGETVRNYNSVTFAFAVEGDFATGERAKHGTPTPEQWAAAVKLTVDALTRYPAAKVTGHAELGPLATYDIAKLTDAHSCPGGRFDMNKFRNDVNDTIASYKPAQS